LDPNLIQWNDESLFIRAEYLPKFFWLTASIDLLVDGIAVISTGGQFKFKGTASKQIDIKGSIHQVRLDWGSFLIASCPCTLIIDNLEIAKLNIKPQYKQQHLGSVFVVWFFSFICPFFTMIAACEIMRTISKSLGGS
jgi:hypothetical protein